MDGFMGTVAVLGSAAILAVIMIYLALMMWRRAWADERPLLLGDMLRRQGTGLVDAATTGSRQQFALAVRRCTACGAEHACRDWLEAGKRDGYEEFCPNAEYIERLKGAAAP